MISPPINKKKEKNLYEFGVTKRITTGLFKRVGGDEDFFLSTPWSACLFSLRKADVGDSNSKKKYSRGGSYDNFRRENGQGSHGLYITWSIQNRNLFFLLSFRTDV
jgi:hypothetical protein